LHGDFCARVNSASQNHRRGGGSREPIHKDNEVVVYSTSVPPVNFPKQLDVIDEDNLHLGPLRFQFQPELRMEQSAGSEDSAVVQRLLFAAAAEGSVVNLPNLA
jgi:hypothetical protein